MTVQRFAAFADGQVGGNPAGVLIAPTLPDEEAMQSIAAEIGFSETAFATPEGLAWRVRYFSPEAEVPFCGHATIALGAALALREGDRVFDLQLNDAAITVEGRQDGDQLWAALQSPPTRSAPATAELVAAVLRLFDLAPGDLDPRLPPAAIHAGADHFVLALADRGRLARMAYDLEQGRTLMRAAGLVTIPLVHATNDQNFAVRNAFASSGIVEDPATGAAAAAFAGYLRDIGWPLGGAIEIIQGEDMGMRSRIRADIPPTLGSSIRVSGTARLMR